MTRSMTVSVSAGPLTTTVLVRSSERAVTLGTRRCAAAPPPPPPPPPGPPPPPPNPPPPPPPPNPPPPPPPKRRRNGLPPPPPPPCWAASGAAKTSVISLAVVAAFAYWSWKTFTVAESICAVSSAATIFTTRLTFADVSVMTSVLLDAFAVK